MNQEKDILTIWKERIAKESKYGDKKKAYTAAEVSETTHDNAMKKTSIDDLSDLEFAALSKHIDILDKRIQKRDETKQRYARA